MILSSNSEVRPLKFCSIPVIVILLILLTFTDVHLNFTVEIQKTVCWVKIMGFEETITHSSHAPLQSKSQILFILKIYIYIIFVY